MAKWICEGCLEEWKEQHASCLRCGGTALHFISDEVEEWVRRRVEYDRAAERREMAAQKAGVRITPEMATIAFLETGVMSPEWRRIIMAKEGITEEELDQRNLELRKAWEEFKRQRGLPSGPLRPC